MPQVIYTEQHDEITDLVDRVRKATDPEVALVLSAGTVGLQTPLNVRLLRQLGMRADKTVSIVSGDPYIQELSRVGGLATYASVPAFERGIQTVRPHSDEGLAAFAAGGATAGAAAPPAPPRSAAVLAPVAAAGGAGKRNRRPLYFVAAGLLILGIILFALVAPSAKVVITLAGTPLTASPTVQGSPDPGNAGQADHIVTSVVSSDQSAQFTATPTGSKQVPATAATTNVVFQTDLPSGASFAVPKGEEFDTQDNPPLRFYATADTQVCIGPNGSAALNCPSGVQANNSVPVQDGTAETKGNVAANTITKWPGNPCNPGQPQNGICQPKDITETNPSAATGGADAKTITVAGDSDISSWNNTVSGDKTTLTTQVNSDLQTKAAGKVFAKDPGGNGTTLSCDVSPALPASGQQFAAAQETVTCHGKGAAYSPDDVTKDVTADLQKQVAQGETLATDAVNCTKASVTQAADNGTVVLSIQCTGFSHPTIDLEALKTQLTGKSSSDARNIIEHRLSHVQNVVISQSPIPFFWLPFFSSRIEIDPTFVQQTGP
jgi:hypothetical protein